MFTELDFSDFFSFIFKEDFILIKKEENPSENVVTVQEDLDGIDRDDTGTLEDLPRFLFIYEKRRNFEVVVNGGDLTTNIKQRKSKMLYKLITFHLVTNTISKNIYSITMQNIHSESIR